MIRNRNTLRGWFVCTLLLMVCWLSAPQSGQAQGTGGVGVSDGVVGYIDPAIPGNMLRFRFDSGYNFRRPTRAEFFYAKPSPAGPGLPDPESGIDHQHLMLHAETLVTDSFSVFTELGTRFLDPELNENTAGLADMNAGFKWAFINTPDDVVTFQFRTYIPTGDAARGLGTDHVSLEPGLLTFNKLSDRLALAAELRYWIPVGGTDFSGDILRYGVGLQYEVFGDGCWYVTPVTEFVGWTVLDGKQGVLFPSGVTGIEDAAGDTIVNVKLGVRFGRRERFDIYAGYGRALTGDRWYEDIFRVEWRLLF